MFKYSISHTTKYQYDSNVGNSANQIILFPISGENQTILEQNLIISPLVNVDYFNDYFQNRIGVFTVVEPHRELVILSELKVETKNTPFPNVQISVAEQWEDLHKKIGQFPYMDFNQTEKFEHRADVEEVLKTILSSDTPIIDAVSAISTYINQNFRYERGVTTVETGVDELWENKAGVCQDFAHMMITMLRLSRIPARYVSGYICPSLDHQMRGEGATHAWVEVYIPTYGWFGNDPTNDCWVDNRHVQIAVGRDFRDCTPVKGTYEGTSHHNLFVSVLITGGDGSQSGLESANVHEIASIDKNTANKVKVVEDKRAGNAQSVNSYQQYIMQQQQQQQQ
ncbi:transglutaminase family protein [Sphingobacterium sp. lm-10]|uniref:transglutaminase family protein n=1 Tax=Sphingobacterium sp. lm-10 TaxID=2944904 RepID=UPI002020C013|nr:transglutaminase family protein [Sphingobacterium sp. lm-10]MCL7989095.1 transglutaminase family protein [Sphingobacterium sp. lm-10]